VSGSYTSAHEAAVALHVYTVSHYPQLTDNLVSRRELAGVIWRDNKGYGYLGPTGAFSTEIHLSDDGNTVLHGVNADNMLNFYSLQLRRGPKRFVGLYHTHPYAEAYGVTLGVPRPSTDDRATAEFWETISGMVASGGSDDPASLTSQWHNLIQWESDFLGTLDYGVCDYNYQSGCGAP
jgi:hypothetical protein